MIGDQTWFLNLDTSVKCNVRLGNGTKLNVAGKGSIRILVDQLPLVIQNVFYVPGLQTNLLSIGQMQGKNLTFVIKRNTCQVFHDQRGLLLETAMKTNKMFVIHANHRNIGLASGQKCLNSEVEVKESVLSLWHRRFGHLNCRSLQELQKKGLVQGLPQLSRNLGVCEICLTGKQHRKAFPKKSNWRATHKLELVHADLCGPITPTSNGGKRYILTIIDDFSRKLWVYFLVAKSEALMWFKKYKAQVEKEIREVLVSLKTDRGGEFLLNEFKQLCEETGIRRQLTEWYSREEEQNNYEYGEVCFDRYKSSSHFLA
ncbi:Retrovirus-related Pol polyprotein from transposon TNT 1-94 [Linum grandiflorum]